MSDSFNNSQADRQRLHLKQQAARFYPTGQKYAAIGAELDRLFNLDLEPQRADYRAVLKCAPELRARLNFWLLERLGSPKMLQWHIDNTAQTLAEAPERLAEAELRARQMANKSGAQLEPANATASAPEIEAVSPTQIEIDRENETQTGKVTALLLCADYGISTSHLGRLLNRWHHGDMGHVPREISTTAPQQLTRADVQTVRARLEIWAQKQEKKRVKSGNPASVPLPRAHEE